MSVLRVLIFFLRALLGNRAVIAAEDLAPRQQLGILQRFTKRPRLRRRDRVC